MPFRNYWGCSRQLTPSCALSHLALTTAGQLHMRAKQAVGAFRFEQLRGVAQPFRLRLHEGRQTPSDPLSPPHPPVPTRGRTRQAQGATPHG